MRCPRDSSALLGLGSAIANSFSCGHHKEEDAPKGGRAGSGLGCGRGFPGAVVTGHPLCSSIVWQIHYLNSSNVLSGKKGAYGLLSLIGCL